MTSSMVLKPDVCPYLPQKDDLRVEMHTFISVVLKGKQVVEQTIRAVLGVLEDDAWIDLRNTDADSRVVRSLAA